MNKQIEVHIKELESQISALGIKLHEIRKDRVEVENIKEEREFLKEKLMVSKFRRAIEMKWESEEWFDNDVALEIESLKSKISLETSTLEDIRCESSQSEYDLLIDLFNMSQVR